MTWLVTCLKLGARYEVATFKAAMLAKDSLLAAGGAYVAVTLRVQVGPLVVAGQPLIGSSMLGASAN